MADQFPFISTLQDLTNPVIARGVQNVELGNDFAGINARGDQLQSWCWYCVPPAVYNTANLDPTSVGGGPVIWLPWYYVSAATLPSREISTKSVQRNGHAKQHPDSYSVGDLTLTLFMDSKNVARQYIRSWESLVLSNDNPRNPSNQGRWGLPIQYKRDISFVIHSVRKKRVLHYKYYGCWPKSISGLELNSGSSDGLTMDVTFAVDDMRVSAGNENIIESFWVPNDIASA